MASSEQAPPRYADVADGHDDMRHVQRTTEKAYRVHAVTSSVVLLLMVLVTVVQLSTTPTPVHVRPRVTSDCIRAPLPIRNVTAHTVWPASDTIRKCIANHAVFVQLEHYCRAIGRYNEIEVHSYLDRARKKLTVTVNVRRNTS